MEGGTQEAEVAAPTQPQPPQPLPVFSPPRPQQFGSAQNLNGRSPLASNTAASAVSLASASASASNMGAPVAPVQPTIRRSSFTPSSPALVGAVGVGGLVAANGRSPLTNSGSVLPSAGRTQSNPRLNAATSPQLIPQPMQGPGASASPHSPAAGPAAGFAKAGSPTRASSMATLNAAAFAAAAASVRRSSDSRLQAANAEAYLAMQQQLEFEEQEQLVDQQAEADLFDLPPPEPPAVVALSRVGPSRASFSVARAPMGITNLQQQQQLLLMQRPNSATGTVAPPQAMTTAATPMGRAPHSAASGGSPPRARPVKPNVPVSGVLRPASNLAGRPPLTPASALNLRFGFQQQKQQPPQRAPQAQNSIAPAQALAPRMLSFFEGIRKRLRQTNYLLYKV